MKLNKKILFSLALFFILFVFVLLFNMDKDEPETGLKSEEILIREKAIVELDPSKMSRVTFFNATKDRVSLAIPEWWEGNYRMKESGNYATFSYIDSQGSSKDLFTVTRYPNNEWREEDGQNKVNKEEKVLKKQNTVYTFYLSTVPNNDKDLGPEYAQMREEISLIIRTIK